MRNRITVLLMYNHWATCCIKFNEYVRSNFQVCQLIPFNIHQMRCFLDKIKIVIEHIEKQTSMSSKCIRKWDFFEKESKKKKKKNILKIFKSILLIKWFGVKGDKETFISPHSLIHDTRTLKIRWSLKYVSRTTNGEYSSKTKFQTHIQHLDLTTTLGR